MVRGELAHDVRWMRWPDSTPVDHDFSFRHESHSDGRAPAGRVSPHSPVLPSLLRTQRRADRVSRMSCYDPAGALRVEKANRFPGLVAFLVSCEEREAGDLCFSRAVEPEIGTRPRSPTV